MSATGHIRGHDVVYDEPDGPWRYTDTGEPVSDRRCASCGEWDVLCVVPIHPRLSATGEARWDVKPVDACIAPFVWLANLMAPTTVASCCGHGRDVPQVILWHGATKETPQ